MSFQFYGNYGGPGWTGGAFVGPTERGNFDVAPKDALDGFFRQHDMDYADAEEARQRGDAGEYWRRITEADNKLIDSIDKLDQRLMDDRRGQPGDPMRIRDDDDMYTAAGEASAVFKAKRKLINEPGRNGAPPTRDEQKAIDKMLGQNGLSLPQLAPWLPGTDPNSPKSLRRILEDAKKDYSKATLVGRESPLVLDLDGDGVETIGISKRVHFDLNANGFAEATAWVSADDGILVLDKNNNNAIDDGAELFGNFTPLTATEHAQNGFEALSQYDKNNDSTINSDDAVFEKLQVWRDLNGNGKADAGELFQLSYFDISSIDLSYFQQTSIDSNGNDLRQVGSYTSKTGKKSIVDIWFDSDTSQSWVQPYVQVSDAIAHLPDLPALGNLPSLREAIAIDHSNELLNLVTDFVNNATVDNAKSKFLAIVSKWTNSDLIREDFNGYDAQRLHVLEQLFGADFYNEFNRSSVVVNRFAASCLDASYDKVINGLFDTFMAQTLFKPAYDLVGVKFDPISKQMELDASRLLTYLSAKYNDDPVSASRFMVDFGGNARNVNDFSNLILEKIHESGDILGSGYSYQLAVMGYEHVVVGTPNSDVLKDLNGLNSIIAGGAGDDSISDVDGDDVVDGGDGDDKIEYTGNGTTKLIGGAGDDQLSSSGFGSSHLDGGDGNDKITYFYYGQTIADGGAGNDVLQVSNPNADGGGKVTLNGGTGDDIITSGREEDTYLFNRGDGRDTITANRGYVDKDKLVFGAGITQDQLSARRVGDDLVLGVADPAQQATDQITFKLWFAYDSAKLDQVVFADGGTMTGAQLTALGNVIAGTEGN
ncbi:calcium-binding protein, partial [Duganella sp. HH101]|uniref:calcium-binding protein n=1 Tax=Duganella sp. HH101 TaxID=1781066 RepID=UPI002570FDEA